MQNGLEYYFQFDNVSMRHIVEADIDNTVALINPAYSYQEVAKGELRTNAQKLHQRIQETDFYVILTSHDIIGCVYLEIRGSSLHFGLLTIAEPYRGTGVAPAVMTAIDKYATAVNCSSIQLDYMSEAPWLKTYYEKYGYQQTGKIKPWGTIDLIRMKKTL